MAIDGYLHSGGFHVSNITTRRLKLTASWGIKADIEPTSDAEIFLWNEDLASGMCSTVLRLPPDVTFESAELSVSQPDDPVVVQFDPVKATYWLAYADAPEDPLLRPDTGDPYVVEFGTGRGEPAFGVSITLIDVADDRLSFDSNGGLVDVTAEPQILLGHDGH